MSAGAVATPDRPESKASDRFTERVYDLRTVANQRYRSFLLPFKIVFAVVAASLWVELIIVILLHGFRPLSGVFGGLLLTFDAALVWIFVKIGSLPPVSLVISAQGVSMITATGTRRSLPLQKPGQRIVLSDFSEVRRRSRLSTVPGGVPRILRVNNTGTLIPLTREALDGLRAFLDSRGLVLQFSGEESTVPGSKVWVYRT